MKISQSQRNIRHEMVSVKPSSTIDEAFEAITQKKGLRLLPVVDDEHKLIGIVPIETLIEFYGAKYMPDVLTQFSHLLAKKVKNIMNQPVSVHLEDNFTNALKIMIETKITDIPVVDDENKLIGSLDCYELLNALKLRKS